MDILAAHGESHLCSCAFMRPDHLHGSLAWRRGAALLQLRAVSAFWAGQQGWAWDSGPASLEWQWFGKCRVCTKPVFDNKMLLEMLATPSFTWWVPGGWKRWTSVSGSCLITNNPEFSSEQFLLFTLLPILAGASAVLLVSSTTLSSPEHIPDVAVLCIPMTGKIS